MRSRRCISSLMACSRSHVAAAFVGLAFIGSSAWAFSVTLGDQDFLDGATPTNSEVIAASAGEPVPFNGGIGADPIGPNFSASWTFTYAAGAYSAGTMTFGIGDHDSQATGNQVAYFTVDGVDLTDALNALFEAHGGAQREVNVYTVDLAPALGQLADGSVTFYLALQGPGLIGSTTVTESPYNSAALDFSTLTVVPEPDTLALLGLGLASLAATRRRKQ